MPQTSKYCPTQSEFEAFPPTLKRKCFSTLERLRYAEVHAQADSQAKSDNIRKSLSRKLTTSRSISRLRHSAYLSEQNQPISMHSSRSGSVYTLGNVTREDALWFSQLPDKIKRGYFSLEEEKLLTAKKEELILNATEENIYKLGQASNQSVPSLQNPSSCLSSIDDGTGYSIFTEEDAEENMDVELTSTLNWLDTELDLSLDDYHPIRIESRSPNADVPRFSNFHKSQPSLATEKSLSSYEIDEQSEQDPHTLQPFKPSRKRRFTERETQWVPNSLPPVPPVPETATVQRIHSRKASVVSIVNTSSRKTSRDLSSPRSSEDQPTVVKNENRPTSIWVPGPMKLPTPPMTPPLPLMESQATHYLDPEARLKLRMYLASASKFDEALEFGFPSLPPSDKNDAMFCRPVTAASSLYRSGKQQKPSRLTTSTFRSRATGTPVTASPVLDSPTSSPQSDFFAIPYNSLSDNQSATQERKTEVQAQLRKIDRDLHGCAAGREMTIRMTLTRPELRADESLLYPSMQDFSSHKPGTSFASNNDSLGLQNLRLEDEARLVTSENQRASSLRRLWSRKQF